jgi:hypothetical protein
MSGAELRAIQITKRRDNAGLAIISGMEKWHWKLSFGNTEVKNHCCKLRTSAAANHASLLESQLCAY